jgi:hypothetical protein
VGKEGEEKGDDQIRLCSHDAGFGWSKSAVAGGSIITEFSPCVSLHIIQFLSDPCGGKLDRVGWLYLSTFLWFRVFIANRVYNVHRDLNNTELFGRQSDTKRLLTIEQQEK